MTQNPIGLFLACGTISLCSCKSERDETKEAAGTSGGGNAERRATGAARPSPLEHVLQMRTPRLQRTMEERYTLYHQIVSLSSEDLLELLEKTSKTRNTPADSEIFGLAISEYAKRSPESVMSWFSSETMGTMEAGFSEACTVLAQSRPEIVKAWLIGEAAKADRGVQGYCFNVVLMTLSNVDAKSAFEFAMTRPLGDMSMNEMVNAIFGNFGLQNAAEADRAAAASLKGPDLESARNNIALAAAGHDPDTALSIAAKIADPGLRGNAIAAIFTILVDSDKAAAISRLQALNPADLQVTLQALAGGFNSIIPKIGRTDPEFLVTLLEKVPPSAANAPILGEILTSLRTKDPEKAMEIIQSLPESPMKSDLFGKHYISLAREDPQAALQSAAAVSDPKLRAAAYRSIGETTGAKGWAETSKLLNSVAEGDKATLLNSAVPYLSYNNPKELADLVADGTISLQAGSKNQVISLLASRLDTADPALARSWLERLPADDQPIAMKGIATNMAKADLSGLANLLQSMPQDKKWEQGVRVLIENVQRTDTEMANQWKGALKNAGYK